MALIYLIDDDEDFRFFAGRAIEIAGHRGRAFSNSRAALDTLAAAVEVPPLVLVDYRMPGLGAAGFITELRREPLWRATRVILVSGAADLARTAQSVGADDCLPKPFDLSAIERIFAAHLNAP